MSKSPSLRRIQADIRELAHDPSERYSASPLENDMFEWHFTIRGADQTEFEGGVYHGRILLPPEYPFKPPHIIFLTPSGRFETGVKICLSFSAYHPELWQPAWGIRLILEALISFLPAPADGAIGALDWSKDERRRLAKKSREWCCPKCGRIEDLLPEIGSIDTSRKASGKFDKEIKKLHELQMANEAENKSKEALGTESDTAKENKGTERNTGINAETNESNEREHGSETDDVSSETPVAHENNLPLTDNSKEADVESDKENGNIQETQVEGNNINQSELPTPDVADGALIDTFWLSDPVINGSIITVAAIVYFLYRKVESLLEELKELNMSH